MTLIQNTWLLFSAGDLSFWHSTNIFINLTRRKAGSALYCLIGLPCLALSLSEEQDHAIYCADMVLTANVNYVMNYTGATEINSDYSRLTKTCDLLVLEIWTSTVSRILYIRFYGSQYFWLCDSHIEAARSGFEHLNPRLWCKKPLIPAVLSRVCASLRVCHWSNQAQCPG